MGKKKAGSCTEADEHRPVAGAPEIAHPDDDEKWELQTAFFTAFLFEMLERVESTDAKSAHAARCELETFLLNSLGQSLRVALDDKDSIAKQWACKLPADVFVSIGKHVGKVKIEKPYRVLMKNGAFRDEKKLIGKLRTDILFPAQVRAIAQRELKQARDYRKRLILLSIVNGWEQTARKQKIPQEYWPAVKLPEFSTDSFDKWFSFLWPLIQEKIEVSELPPLAQRDLDTGGIRTRTRYLADSRKTAYDHLEALARLRDKGVF